MDFLSIEPDQSNTKDVLVLTDHFTKYAIAIPTPNQKAQTVAKCLWDHFIVHYGIPERLHSDQGPDFESHIIRELCKIMGIHKIRTTPYHPRGNPVERFNRTLLSMLGTLEQKDKTQWRNFVKPLVHAYNCTKNDTTGFAPYELMFGRRPRLPVDLAFNLPFRTKSFKSHSQYVEKLKTTLQESYKLATENANKMADRNKARFDMRVKPSKLEPGDRVLVRAVRLRGKHKLADRWETDIYVVVKQAGDLPVYTIKPETKNGPVRTVHRDLLLPCGFLAPTEENPTPPNRVCKPKTRQSPKQTEECDLSEPENEDVYRLREQPVPEPIKFMQVYEFPRQIYPENLPESDNVPGCDNLPESDNVPGCENLPENDNVPGCDNLPECDDVPGCENSPGSDNTPGCESVSECKNLPDCDDTPGSDPVVPTEEELETVADTEPVVQDNDRESETNVPSEKGCNKQVSEDTPMHPSHDTTNPVRRSERPSNQPNRLQYNQLGNPLLTIAQSLFHGLSLAFTSALTETDLEATWKESSFPVISMQPTPCKETCMFQGGNV
ncbi:uncharacterized protein LOC115800532 [Archocentrus centrarchus]|uniref:uncharacterized protein LOC115800532 n=1 Tax=Archocentrus centrarchus TaxID=63155 RepID=UPI0011EA2B89|nr:uncharacterized protein LOC115800532 [Archocentrus centrarchus]